MNIEKARFFSIGFHEPKLPWHMGAHSHDKFEMIVATSGAQRVMIGNKEIHAQPGDILLYPPGCPHEEWADAGQEFASYFFGFSWPDPPPDIPWVVHDRHGRIHILTEWLHAETRSAAARDPFIGHALFQALLSQFIRLWTYRENAWVERIRGHILRNISSPIRLDDLAAVADLSKFHFVRRYRELTGRTPMEDARVIRLERARDLLLTTSHPIKRVAEEVGFASVYHLCRLFKTQYGTSPGHLRRP